MILHPPAPRGRRGGAREPTPNGGGLNPQRPARATTERSCLGAPLPAYRRRTAAVRIRHAEAARAETERNERGCLFGSFVTESCAVTTCWVRGGSLIRECLMPPKARREQRGRSPTGRGRILRRSPSQAERRAPLDAPASGIGEYLLRRTLLLGILY